MFDSLKPGQVRLLHLRPPAFYSHQIVCHLEIISLATSVKVRCTLIHMGQSSLHYEVIICKQPCRVTTNLYDALGNLRCENGRTRTLWIDAICTYSDRSSMKHLRHLRPLIQYLEEPSWHPIRSTENPFFGGRDWPVFFQCMPFFVVPS